MEGMVAVLKTIGDVLWGPWTPWVLLSAGVLFTVWTRFTQWMALTHGVAVVRGIYDNPDDPGAINHFQALSAALSATVGLGNIGGVALAIGMGGPGALFWMWVVAVFGMALKTVEITLAMMYRDTSDPDNPHGGAMWVVHRVLGAKGGAWPAVGKAIGIFFCITLVISTFTGGNMFQSWSVAQLTLGYFGVPRLATGIVMALLVGAVIIGGIKRIGNVAGKLVPFMCLLYIVAALAVLATHVGEIPAMLKMVIVNAFEPTKAGGAFLGASAGFGFMIGMKRALFSNEAGQGSAPIAHSAAKTNEPAREGIVGGIGPFIDTICICTMTALVIILTGTWNRAPVGDFGGPITLEMGSDATEWVVRAPTDPKLLPEPKFDPWVAGAYFYLVGEVKGATEIESSTSHVRVLGKLVEKTAGSDEAKPELMIEWQPIAIPADAWQGTPAEVRLVGKGVHRRYDGANMTGHAFDRAFPGLGKWLVTFAAWLFALSTMISWSYYGEQGMVYMLGGWSVLPYKILFCVAAVYAAAGIQRTSHMEVLMDLGTGAMLWANLPIVIGLGFLAVRSLNTYGRRLKAGEFPRVK